MKYNNITKGANTPNEIQQHNQGANTPNEIQQHNQGANPPNEIQQHNQGANTPDPKSNNITKEQNTPNEIPTTKPKE